MNTFTAQELESEQWRPIFGYEKYEVSSLGRVRSKHSGEWQVLRPGKNNRGYLIIALHRNGKGKTCTIHRLVAQAFIPNDNIFNTEVNHINEDKTDNRASNLEYCDRQYNMTYNDIHLRRKNSKRPKRSKIKELYDPNLNSKQNIENFRANGIECSRGTITNLRRDLGLIHH